MHRHTSTTIAMTTRTLSACYAELAAAQAALTLAGLALADAVCKSKRLDPALRIHHLHHLTTYCTAAALCVSEGPQVLGELTWLLGVHKTAPSLWTVMFLAAERVVAAQESFLAFPPLSRSE